MLHIGELLFMRVVRKSHDFFKNYLFLTRSICDRGITLMEPGLTSNGNGTIWLKKITFFIHHLNISNTVTAHEIIQNKSNFVSKLITRKLIKLGLDWTFTNLCTQWSPVILSLRLLRFVIIWSLSSPTKHWIISDEFLNVIQGRLLYDYKNYWFSHDCKTHLQITQSANFSLIVLQF